MGASAPEAQSAVEENLFQEIPDFLERIALLEDELIDEYVFGQLAPDEAAKFEQHFLCTEERRQKLAFSQSLRQFAIDRFAAHSSEESASARLSFLAVLRAHRWQVYCAVALLFASLSMACVVFYRSKQAELLARVEQADAEIHRLQQESRPASTPGVDARNQTDASRAIPGRPSTQSPGSYQVAVTEPLTLDAGLTRGSGQLKRLKISAGTNLAQITLRLTEPLSGAIHESLLTADQQEKWSRLTALPIKK